MQDISLYQFESNGEQVAYSKAMLDATSVATTEVDANDGSPVMTLLDTPTKVEQAFPGGKWRNIELVGELRGKHKLKAEELCWVPDPKTGMREYHISRRPLAYVCATVKNWDFPRAEFPLKEQEYPLTPDIFLELPSAVSDLIQDLVWLQCEGQLLSPQPKPVSIAP